jgi:hypothetical protein
LFYYFFFNSEASGIFVGATGLFNTGKTWLMSKLTGVPLPTGNTVHTIGMSILAFGNMFLLDTQGLQSPGVRTYSLSYFVYPKFILQK